MIRASVFALTTVLSLTALGACGAEDASEGPTSGDQQSTENQLVAECSGTSGEWLGCRGHGCAVCSEVTEEYPYYFVNHPLCDKNLTCDNAFYECNANCPTPTEEDKVAPPSECNGTPGEWNGCRGNGCAACSEALVDYPFYFLHHPKCVRNDTCADTFYQCNSNCPTPTEADKLPPEGTCNGSASGWLGCRGTGCSACAELTDDYPLYYKNHPSCVRNTTCQDAPFVGYYACSSNCPEPTDADRFVAVPGRIEAEDYLAFSESDSVNHGALGTPFCDRADGVDLEKTEDQAGACNIGWTQAGEALEYGITVASAGSYDIVARLASAVSGTSLRVRVDGTDVGTLTSPNAGWQGFEDRAVSNVALSAGNHTIRVEFITGSLNLNSIDVLPGQSVPHQSFTQRIEAESYTAFSESDSANHGGACDKADGVDKQTTSDRSGGCRVGWTNAGEWLSYDLDVPVSGDYQLMLRVGSALSGKTVRAYIDGNPISDALAVTQQPAWDLFQDLGITTSLSAGAHDLRIEFVTGAVDFNYLRVTQVAKAPAVVRAWEYGAFSESDTTNSGAAGSPQCDLKDGVDFEVTGDAGGGCNLGWTTSSEWLEYKVSDADLGSGPWSFIVRAASGASSARTISVSVDGGGPSTYSVANLGWQSFQDIAVTVPSVANQAIHTVRIGFPQGSVNLNTLSF